MAWIANGTTTLESDGDTCTITDQTSTKFNNYFSDTFAGSGNVGLDYRVGNGSIDSGSNYAYRRCDNYGSDATAVNTDKLHGSNSAWGHHFGVGWFVNISDEEKLFIHHVCEQGSAGAGTAPSSLDFAGKWVNTSNQSDQIQAFNRTTGDYDNGSNITALGTD